MKMEKARQKLSDTSCKNSKARKKKNIMDETQVEDMEEPEDELPRRGEECDEADTTEQEADKGNKVRRRTSNVNSQEQ